jgi:hypothetical protein
MDNTPMGEDVISYAVQLIEGKAVMTEAGCRMMANSIIVGEKKLAETNSALVQARSIIDGLDCTQREGGQTLHCRIENPCLRCQLAAANKRADEARALAIESMRNIIDAERCDDGESMGYRQGYNACASNLLAELDAIHTLPPTHCTVSIDDLNKLRLIHKECEDGFYSCPLSTEGCLNDYSKGCTCGADEHNAAIDAMLSARNKP